MPETADHTNIALPIENNHKNPNFINPETEEEDDDSHYLIAETVDDEENLRLDEREIQLIKRALERNNGKRKIAAEELGISERTLYRKIKQYDL
ncbi:helix-turn-helix domain-containing protein [Paenimyroides ceti]